MILRIYFAGLVILGAALLLNAFAYRVKVKTWYDFAKKPKHTRAVDYAWLFVFYPFCLGLAGALALLFLLD